MKPKTSFRSFLTLSGSTLLLVSQSQAAYYYWDSNGTAAGLGDTAGTWGTSAFHALVNAPNGRGLIGGTLATAATATTGSDTMNFGTINLGLGSTASTIGIAGGGVTINNITFGFGQANAVTLSGGGGSITLAGTTPTIYVNNASDTIGAALAGTLGMTKAGPGTLNLTGANLYTGTTNIIGGGSLNVGNGSTGSLTSGALTFNSGAGTFNVAQASGSSQTMGALTFTAGDATVRSTAASGSATQTLTFASLAARAVGATGNFDLATNTTAADNKIVLTSTTNAPLDNSGSNNSGIFFGGTEYGRYDTTNNHLRAVNYGADNNAAALVSGTTIGTPTSATDVKLNGNVTAQNTASVNTLNLAGNNLTFQDTASTLGVNGILSSGGSSAAIANGANASSIQTNDAAGELVIRVNGSTDALTIAPDIVNNGDSSLTKSGAGLLTLSGANTYAGATTINAGTLAVSGGSAIADTGAVVLANAAGTTFKLNANETIGNLSGGGFSGGVVDVQGNTLTFGDSGNQSYGGTFTGTASGTIVKQGSGTLTLSNANTFAGTTTLSGGTLTFTLGNSGTTSAQSISSGGAINMAGGTTMSFVPTNQVALGQNTGNSPAQLTAPNGWTIGNPINITSGTATFRFTQNGNRWNFTGDVTGGASDSQTLNILQGNPAGGGGDSQAILFSGVIQDGAGGTLGVNADFTASSGLAQSAFINLSGANTFTGPITVANTRGLTNGAFLTIGGERTNNTTGITAGSGSLGTISPGTGNYTNTISLATGTTLNYASSANQTLGGVISGAGSILKHGNGTLTLSVANTYTGTTTVSAGTLALSGANTTTGANIISGGTLAIASIDNVANPNPLGQSSASAANLVLRGGTLQYITGGAASTDRNFAIFSSSTIDASGSGPLNFTQTGAVSPDVTGLSGTTTAGSAVITGLSSTADFVVGMAVNMTGVPAGRTIASINSSTQITLNSGTSVTAGTNAASFGYPTARTLTLTGTNTGNNTIAGVLQNSTAAGTGTLSLSKTGNGTWVLGNANTYTGATTVSAGTLLVSGSLGNSAVTVNGGAFGGTGTIGSTLSMTSGSFHVVDLLDALQVTGTVTLYAGFGVDDLAGLTWGSVADGTYTLIDGTLGAGVFAGLSNNSLATAYDIGGGRGAYFQEGSLQLVVIPEPRAALLGTLGLLALLRRRRA